MENFKGSVEDVMKNLMTTKKGALIAAEAFEKTMDDEDITDGERAGVIHALCGSLVNEVSVQRLVDLLRCVTLSMRTMGDNYKVFAVKILKDHEDFINRQSDSLEDELNDVDDEEEITQQECKDKDKESEEDNFPHCQEITATSKEELAFKLRGILKALEG